MKIGLWVTILYVALTYGSGYIETYTPDFLEIGVGQSVLNLIGGALADTADAIGTVALTVGLALPSIKDALVRKIATDVEAEEAERNT